MSHFYTKDGTFIDGLRAARKISPLPYPSPTTVLSMLKGEGLIAYFRRQMWQATCTTPRTAEMTDEEHYKACERWADEHGLSARTFGQDAHSAIRTFNRSVLSTDDYQTNDPRLQLYANWFKESVRKVFHVEQFVIGDGYAGTEDLRVLLNDGRVASVDVKTQDISKKKGFNKYLHWAMQLGAYAMAGPPDRLSYQPDCIISICISSTGLPQLEAYEWPKPPGFYENLFLGLLRIWKVENNYD